VRTPTNDRSVWVLAAALVGSAAPALADDLAAGPGRQFARIEEALAAAHRGDTILVHPSAADHPCERVALLVRTPGLTFRAVPEQPGGRVRLSGEGFEFSGIGRTPRAIVQFDPGSDGCLLEGFELDGAHNGSHNGAGVRINQADHITIRACTIHGNDMGVMSNGDAQGAGASDQRTRAA
jgi:hypothetical protein